MEQKSLSEKSLSDLRRRLDEAVLENEAEFQFKRIAAAVASHYPRVSRVTVKNGRLLSVVARVPEDHFPSMAAVELYDQYAYPVTPKGEAVLHVWGNIGNNSQRACEFVAGLLAKAGIQCRPTKFKGDNVVAFMPLERVSEATEKTSLGSVLAGLGFVRTRPGHGSLDGYYSTDDGGPVDTMQLHDGLIGAGLKMATHYMHASMRGREFPRYSSYGIEHQGGGTNVTLHWATKDDPTLTKGVTVNTYTTRD